VVPPALIYFFETGDEDQSRFKKADRYSEFLIGFPQGKGRDLIDFWQLCKKQVITDWIRRHPGSRPFYWWAAEATEPRGPGESETAYLKRHNLLTPAEKRHLKTNPGLLRPGKIEI
jgi:hypothetical protein